jgi:hypothetical protein
MSCTPPSVIIDGIEVSASDYVNATELLTVSGDGGDPTYDEYEGNIANGNNNKGSFGIQFPNSEQTTLPTSIPYTANESNITPGVLRNGSATVCPIWDGTSYNVYLSPNFTLANFTIGAYWKHQLSVLPLYPALTQQIRFCNLMNLALNVAEPLRAKLGNLFITSGLRNTNSVKPPGISQHVSGQAMDVQFTGWSYQRYWDNAQWVKDNIAYDQFIFEHSSNTGSVWYHLSFNSVSNRVASDSTKVMTMYRNHYDSGLKRYG